LECRSRAHEPKELGMSDDTFPDRLAAAQHGDDAAFTELFRATQPTLLRYLRVVAQADADDLAADTWVQVVRGLRSFSGDEQAAFRAWVLSIARHRWLDHLRSRRRRHETVMASVPEQAAPADPVEFVYELMSTEAALDLIRTLPREQAEVVMLRYVADLDIARIAELLGKQPGAVRVLSHRGLNRLRAGLNAVPDQRSAAAESASEGQPGVAEDQV
jgi:RNA polymerase sigma-70 factor, ECF subfamily